jgi:pantothenate kinase
MDGFHLANQELVRLGRRDRKGAPDTFDVDGYTALLRRMREPPDCPIYAPIFNREIEESIGSALPVPANTPLVITEGNYLLLEGHGWEAVRSCLDEVWYLDIDPELREQRLLMRRQSFGESAAEARVWVRGVDEANASIVESTRGRADLLIHLRT